MCAQLTRIIRLAAISSVLIRMPNLSIAANSQQPAETRNWKDRQEYDLFSKMSQATDAITRLNLLNTWQESYPQSDMAALRLKYYVATLASLAQTNAEKRQLLLDKCEELLKLDPKDANALYQVALWGPVIGGSSPSSELAANIERAAGEFVADADTVFASTNKPANISDADFAKGKSFRLGVAHDALAWAAIIKKDPQAAEAEYKAGLTANPEQGAAAAQYAKLLYEQKRYPEALFEYARAAQYAGPGPAVSPAARPQLMEFFEKTYKAFHGSMDGADQVLAQAKTNALPPSGFTIADAATIEANNLSKRMASDPGFGLWYTIRQNLTGDQGDQFFEKSMKDTLIPGGANGVRTFSGTVISVDASGKLTKILIGVDDPSKPDATLEFSKRLTSAVLDKVRPGQRIEFSGLVESYAKDPYMLTFKDPSF